MKGHTREVGREARLESLWRDFRYAGRTLRRSPAFAPMSCSENPGMKDLDGTSIQKPFWSVSPWAVGAISVIGFPSEVPE